MPGALNYQPSQSAVYYTPPQRIHIGRTILWTAIAGLLTIVATVVYVKLMAQFDWIMLRIAGVFAAAIGAGVISLVSVHYGKIRLPIVAACIGAFVGLLALYVMWIVWIHDVFVHFNLPISYWRLVVHPISLFHLIRGIYHTGTWELGGRRLYGPPLLVLWLLEAGAVLAGAVLMPIKGIRADEVVCLFCGAGCRSIGRLPRFAAEHQAPIVAAIENRDFMQLTPFPAPANEDAPELVLRVLACPKCKQTNVLTLNHLAWTIAGPIKVQATPVINQLLIAPHDVESIEAMGEQVDAQREAEESKS